MVEKLALFPLTAIENAPISKYLLLIIVDILPARKMEQQIKYQVHFFVVP
jgi:hypothetical protein